MTSIAQSLVTSEVSIEQNAKQNNILEAVLEYNERYESQDESDDIENKQELKYQGFQNKKSIKIKPIKMFKDHISLKKENVQKRTLVRNIEKTNQKLKVQYQNCIKNNAQLEVFLKQVEFTFQHDYNKSNNDEVMIRTKKTLNYQTKQAKQRLHKMFKNSQASTIQEIKVYINVLEQQKAKLKEKVQVMKERITNKTKQADFNKKHEKKFETACSQVRNLLEIEYLKSTNIQRQYKNQRIAIKNNVRYRQYQTKKKILRQEEEQVKKLLLESEGLEYEIMLLKNRIKDRKKQNEQSSSLQQKIVQKQTNIIRLEKQLRQKSKTHDYMLEWTKQLKKQLQDRKSDHAKKKAYFQQQINALSQDYEKYNQRYKTGLYQEQVAKRKGQKQQQVPNMMRQQTKGRQITFLEIKNIAKNISYKLLEKGISIDKFLDQITKFIENKRYIGEKQSRKGKLKSLLSLDMNITVKDTISVINLIQNFQALGIFEISREELSKFVRFVIEDGNGRADDHTVASLNIVKQVLKNLLKRQLSTYYQIIECSSGLKELCAKYSDNLRADMKIAGGREEQISMNILESLLNKYGVQSFFIKLYAEFIEFYGWKKRGSVDFIKLEDFDEVVFLLKQEDENRFLRLLEKY